MLPPDLASASYRQFSVASYAPNYDDYLHAAVPYVRAPEQEMAERVGASFLDVTRAFDGVEGQVCTDYAHLTPLGNEVIANRIAGHILPLIEHQPRSGE